MRLIGIAGGIDNIENRNVRLEQGGGAAHALDLLNGAVG